MSQSEPPAAATPLPPPQLRNYRLLRPLGSGGFSDVYLYEQIRPRREVAIKVLRPSPGETAPGRQVETEADLMATVSRHHYIVTVLDADVAPDGREYIAMEYYPGQSLAARVRQGPLPTAEVLRIGIQLCGAVETAHRHGIVHRDIKPANVLTDPYQHPKLTDFGIAGRRGERGDGAMSPPWSPPEVVSRRSIPDERSDVYSLAATLWHLLAGRSPFETPDGDNSRVALRRRIENDPVPWIGRPDVPQSLERVLQQALSKNPAARQQSALALARALQSVQQELGHPLVEPEVPQDADPATYTAVPDGTATAGQSSADPTDLLSSKITAQPPSGGLIDGLPLPAPGSRQAPPAPVGYRSAASTPAVPPLADTEMRQAVSADDAPQHVPDDLPDPRRSRSPLPLLAVALTVLLLATGLVAYLSRSRGGDREADSANVPSVTPSAQDVMAAVPPPPAPTGSGRRTGPQSAEFTWSVSEPSAVAFYVVRRTDAGTGVRPVGVRVTKTRYTLAPIGDGDAACLEVRSGASNGSTSAPVVLCL